MTDQVTSWNTSWNSLLYVKVLHPSKWLLTCIQRITQTTHSTNKSWSSVDSRCAFPVIDGRYRSSHLCVISDWLIANWSRSGSFFTHVSPYKEVFGWVIRAPFLVFRFGRSWMDRGRASYTNFMKLESIVNDVVGKTMTNFQPIYHFINSPSSV